MSTTLSKIACGLCIATAPLAGVRAQETARADRVQESIRQARARPGDRLATAAEVRPLIRRVEQQIRARSSTLNLQNLVQGLRTG